MCTFTFYASICQYNHRSGHSKRTWSITRCSRVNLTEKQCPNIDYESSNNKPIDCLECQHEEKTNCTTSPTLPAFLRYHIERGVEDVNMDTLIKAPRTVQEEIVFFREYLIRRERSSWRRRRWWLGGLENLELGMSGLCRLLGGELFGVSGSGGRGGWSWGFHRWKVLEKDYDDWGSFSHKIQNVVRAPHSGYIDY